MLQVVFDTFIHDTEMFLTDFYLSKSESSGINIYKNTISIQKHISVPTLTHIYICITQINTEYPLMTNQFGRKVGLSAEYTMPL